MKKYLLKIIAFYRTLKFHHPIFHRISNLCLYEQKCSKYAYHCINRFGIIKGIYLSLKRIYSCSKYRRSELYEFAPRLNNEKNRQKNC